MRFKKKQTLFLTIILFISGLLSLCTTVCQAQEIPSLAEIQAAIEAEGANWVAGPTAVSGLSLEQLCGGKFEKEVHEGEAPSLPLENAFPLDAPAALDWRNYNGQDWTTPIRDQSTCGCCYIFATVAATEAAMKVQAGTYGYLADPDLSEQFVLSCGGFSCGGGTLYNTLDYLRDTGSTDESCFPYTASDTTPCTNRCSNWSDRIHQIESWGNVTPTTGDIKTAIQTYGPIPTAMRAFPEFTSYRGGVYQHVLGTAWQLHYVTLVGWIDSQQCWIGKNSWGTDWGETIDFQATSPGATDGGWFRIRWGECWIGNDVRYLEVGLPNLTDYPHSGWTYSLVPRNTTGTLWSSCPLPATLNGNQNTTYVNFAGINNGSEPAPPFGSYWFVDDVYVGWANWGKIGVGGGFYVSDLGPLTVRGGRHTLGINLDINDQVWESNETNYDNKTYRQFVWSPYALSDDSPITRSAPPKKDSYGYTYYNNDGFSFYVNNEGSDKWWSAVGVLPSNISADYDVRLWGIGDYTGSEQGFGGGYLESSAYSGSVSDFIIVNHNVASAGTYYAGTINYNEGAGDFGIEEDTSVYIFLRPATEWNGPWAKVPSNVLDVYEVYLSPGDYYFYLDQTAGTCDLGMTLYDDDTVTAGKSEYMSGGYANSNGDGGDESFDISISDTGWYGLVLWKGDASDYNKGHTYRIAVGPPTVTVATPNGSETWNAWTWQWITWDPFGYLGDYVNIEISRDGGSTWSTIPGAGSQVNDGSYNWYVSPPGSTQCRIRITSTSHSTYTDTSNANFTINHDSSPPTPNPMTWETGPHARSTSLISMVATTASDPTTPINYFFDFTTSPTGGSGGTDSGWQASTMYTDSGLQGNHQYGYRVKARDGNNNETAYSALNYIYTLANVPGAAGFSNITETSIRANWTTNENPAGTRYYCQNTTAGTNSGWVTSTSWNSTGLAPGTSYTFRVKARNGDLVETDWRNLGSQSTLPGADPCECDLNNDGSCNILDWPYFIEDWGRTDCNDPGVDCECDLNNDGGCNILDWPYFIEDWGRTDCPVVP